MLPKLLSTAFSAAGVAKFVRPALVVGSALGSATAWGNTEAEQRLAQLNGGLNVAMAAALCTCKDQKSAMSLAAGWFVVAVTHYYESFYGGYAAPFSPASLVAVGIFTLLFVSMLARAGPSPKAPTGLFASVGKLLATVFMAASVWMYRQPHQLVRALYGDQVASSASPEAESVRFLSSHAAAYFMFMSAAVCTVKDRKAALSISTGFLAGLAAPFAYAVHQEGLAAPVEGLAAVAATSVLMLVLALTGPAAGGARPSSKKQN